MFLFFFFPLMFLFIKISKWVRRPLLPPAQVVALAAVLGRGVVVGSEAAAFMMDLLQVVRDHWVHVLVPVGFVLDMIWIGRMTKS